ncbi:MAG: hypothetical protein ABIF71_13880 [Planctomycetota bacterium]
MRGRMLTIALVILLGGMLIPLQHTINQRRRELVPAGDVFLAITPGEFAGTLMLGGFRGIAIDILWLRAQKLQQEGKFFELVALSDLIAKLQPLDRMVWEFNSWNRAYNVSVKFNDREDRWKWVKSGLDLNEEGLRRMPRNWKLCKHLAFMFMHKGRDYQEEVLRDYGTDNFSLARRYYQEALRLNPDAPLFVDRAVIHTYEEQGDFETARRLYDEHMRRYPNDTTALQNRDAFLKEKEAYQATLEALAQADAEGASARVVELYEDRIVGAPYLMPQRAIEAVLKAYWATEAFDQGIDFIHKRINLKMEDPEACYREYDTYGALYNAHYLKQIQTLAIMGLPEEIVALYGAKFREKKVDISLDAGIMVLDAMLAAGAVEEARDLLVELEGNNASGRLAPYRTAVAERSSQPSSVE